MSTAAKPAIGSIGWVDLTVPEASPLREFYSAVTGWTHQGCDMGGYQDYVMQKPESGEGVAGVCHARGSNANLPPVWLIYIIVANLDESITKCKQMGGAILGEPRSMGPQGRYCIIRDPAGAHCALFEQFTAPASSEHER